ncbi:MAG: hydantoinase/oxoprolinase family protein [Acetobacteraceae bacterium]
MIAFGGAAPLHAVRLAQKLGIRRVLIPADAGVGSALGFLMRRSPMRLRARSWSASIASTRRTSMRCSPTCGRRPRQWCGSARPAPRWKRRAPASCAIAARGTRWR